MIRAQRRNSSAKDGASHARERPPTAQPVPLRKHPIVLALAGILLAGWLVFLAVMAFRE
jgi:hypothetical protein